MHGNWLIPRWAGRVVSVLWMSAICATAVPAVHAQAQRDLSVEEASRLLQGEEFMGRGALLARGAPILPVLLKLFDEGASDTQLVRIMSVLRDIDGGKEAFIPRLTALARSTRPSVQTGALLALTEIGSTEQAGAFEAVLADTQQRPSARVLAAGGLAKLGTAASLEFIGSLLPVERARTGNRSLVTALETAQTALQKRLQQ